MAPPYSSPQFLYALHDLSLGAQQVLGQGTPKSQAERDDLIYDSYRRYGYSMTSIARELGLHNSTISRIIKAKKNS